jgi:transposase DDE domain
MLFGVLKHFDSMREVEIGMKAEVKKLHHLGIDYVVRRSMLAEANKRRSQEFFASVYTYLLERYGSFLADSCPKGEQNTWEKLLYMMDSTAITLFDNILKGVGRHPKSGKKKGGMKVHTVMKYHVGVPMVVQLTSAAKHDHYLLKEVHLPKDATLTMDRAYVDYAQFHRLTEEGVCYMTKMKKNLTYKEVSSNPQNDKLIIMVERANAPSKELDLFHWGAWFSKITRNYLYKGNSTRIYTQLKFYRTAIKE